MSDKRLIDANALMKNIGKIPQLRGITYGRMKKAVEETPTIDAVEVVHGRWDKPVEHGLPYAANHLGVVCSYCCKWSDNDYNYCPNCGAKMDAKDMDVPTKDGGADNV